jgi:hypothetical protein
MRRKLDVECWERSEHMHLLVRECICHSSLEQFRELVSIYLALLFPFLPPFLSLDTPYPRVLVLDSS